MNQFLFILFDVCLDFVGKFFKLIDFVLSFKELFKEIFGRTISQTVLVACTLPMHLK
jgi:hypothetical protein